jgi:hypothetical protein
MSMAHVFIYTFTCKYELVMDNALEVKSFCKLYQRIPATFEATVHNNHN